jgi:hypothetical protein
MAKRYRFAITALLMTAAGRAQACEPVVPFMQVIVPALALSGSILVLAGAVLVKSALFALFERRLPRLRAAWRMFLGNVLTSIVGLLVAAMIANGAIWLVGVPLVCLLCWLPSRRLVEAAPLGWLARISPAVLAALMTIALLASCMLFMAGQGAISAHRLLLYWIIKLAAIVLALLASITLTTVWEEWAIWRLSGRPEGVAFFAAALRANLYVLVLVMVVPAALILPKRLKSPDFLARRPKIAMVQNVSPIGAFSFSSIRVRSPGGKSGPQRPLLNPQGSRLPATY